MTRSSSRSKVQHILVRHEQGAGHAAEGYARSTGKAGVALVTSGPGATNMVTPLTDALMDSIPIVCITGQVPTHLIGNDAFQECDTVGITRPCTKHNWLVRDVNDLSRIIHEAFYVANPAGPARCWSTSRRTCSSPTAPTPARATSSTRAYHPRIKGDPQRDPRRGRADRQGQAAGLLHRRRRHQFRPAAPRRCSASSST